MWQFDGYNEMYRILERNALGIVIESSVNAMQ
jgi:hypothetical protein